MTNYCKGCRLYSLKYQIPCVDNNDGNCPCTKCIIKVMCRVACREYTLFVISMDKYCVEGVTRRVKL